MVKMHPKTVFDACRYNDVQAMKVALSTRAEPDGFKDEVLASLAQPLAEVSDTL